MTADESYQIFKDKHPKAAVDRNSYCLGFNAAMRNFSLLQPGARLMELRRWEFTQTPGYFSSEEPDGSFLVCLYEDEGKPRKQQEVVGLSCISETAAIDRALQAFDKRELQRQLSKTNEREGQMLFYVYQITRLFDHYKLARKYSSQEDAFQAVHLCALSFQTTPTHMKLEEHFGEYFKEHFQ